MADSHPNLQSLIKELGFAPSEQEFLRRLFGSSDPFAGLPDTDLEAARGRDQSFTLRSRSIAQRLASLESGSRAQRLSQSPPRHSTTQSLEITGNRSSVHYEEEWISLIAAESESLISELLQQIVPDNEPSQIGIHDPASSSVYDSDIGEPSDFRISPNQGHRETQTNSPTPPGPRTSTESLSLEELIASFPPPPSLRGNPGHMWSFMRPRETPRGGSFVPSAQANSSTFSGPANTLDTPDKSIGITVPPPSHDKLGGKPPSTIRQPPRRSSREICRPERQPKYTLVPRDSVNCSNSTNRKDPPPRIPPNFSRKLPANRHTLNTDSVGYRRVSAEPRVYKQTPLRICTSASAVSNISPELTPELTPQLAPVPEAVPLPVPVPGPKLKRKRGSNCGLGELKALFNWGWGLIFQH